MEDEKWGRDAGTVRGRMREQRRRRKVKEKGAFQIKYMHHVGSGLPTDVVHPLKFKKKLLLTHHVGYKAQNQNQRGVCPNFSQFAPIFSLWIPRRFCWATDVVSINLTSVGRSQPTWDLSTYLKIQNLDFFFFLNTSRTVDFLNRRGYVHLFTKMSPPFCPCRLLI